MASVTYKSNADAIIRAIAEASTEGPKEAVDHMVATGRQFCPVRSGRLQRTIHREAGDDRYSQDFVAGGDDAHYAPFVNYGTRNMRANPFFTHAFEKHAGDVVDAFLTRLQKAGK